MFAVQDIDAVVAGLQARGSELVGDVVQYEDSYRLCYIRGPEGILVALAEALGDDAATTEMTPDPVDGQVYGG